MQHEKNTKLFNDGLIPIPISKCPKCHASRSHMSLDVFRLCSPADVTVIGWKKRARLSVRPNLHTLTPACESQALSQQQPRQPSSILIWGLPTHSAVFQLNKEYYHRGE